MSQISRLRDAEISNGNLINADDIDAELNQLVTESNVQDTRITTIESSAMTIAGVKTFTSAPKADQIDERTADTGVTVDGVLCKDGFVRLPAGAGYTPTTNGELGYDATSHTYDVVVNGNAEALLHTGSVLTDLDDVTITTPASGHTLIYNGTGWVNTATGYLHVRDEKTSGTAGGTSSANTWMTRDLNTVVTNTISGASLSSNQITLPAGTYEVIRAWGPVKAVNGLLSRMRLRNITDSTSLLEGENAFGGSTSSTNYGTVAMLSGVFTINSQKTIELQQRVTNGTSTDGLGSAMSEASVNEKYAGIMIRRIA